MFKFTNPTTNTRANALEGRYRLFVPSEAHGALPLLVMIHGCDQDAAAFERGSRMNSEAERSGFCVLYPDQLKGRNPMNCWRWFDPKNRRPQSGELKEILEMIDEVASRNQIDRSRIYVAGISSGAATASALLACHPGRFKGAVLHSSPAFDVASNAVTGFVVQKYGPFGTRSLLRSGVEPRLNRHRLLIIQGSGDDMVNPRHATKLINQFVTAGIKPERRNLSLDSMGERKTSTFVYRDAHTGSLICHVEVEGMKHAWAGGEAQKYFDPKSFSATELVTRFLIRGEEPFT